MNRKERRKLQKKGVSSPKDPVINIKRSELLDVTMSPTMKSAMIQEINRQVLEADKKYALDIISMVLWSLRIHSGWGKGRLTSFYRVMITEYLKMRKSYNLEDTFPEQYYLKQIGVDVESLYEETMRGELDDSEKSANGRLN